MVTQDFLSKIIPAVRMIFSQEELKVCSFQNTSSVDHFFQHADSYRLLEDHEIANYQLAPLLLEQKEDPDDFITNFRKRLHDYRQKYELDPKVIFIKAVGILAVAESKKAADFTMDFYLKLLENEGEKSREIDIVHENLALTSTLDEIKLSKSIPGKVENSVAIVTGGAQGFGLGIVKDLFSEGCNVIIADINETVGDKAVNDLNHSEAKNKVKFIKTNVSNAESVQQMVTETILAFGGLDILISNAGVLRAGSLEELDEQSFDFVTNVNYKGFFICTKYGSVPMKVQHQYHPQHFMDIIQINSKSGLQGSNKNFAYAGGKFGGIGLTQSFALELIEHHIKVNAICPGNFFEGPLWSDPEKGLFAQYLKAGKVPGAQSIQDVKKFYEDKVPMKRGCYPEDVMKAIYYIVSQQYETGQAIPVTGGQIMLN